MQKTYFAFILALLFSCSHIKTGDRLSKHDIGYIKSLHLLDDNETIYKFYSTYKIKNSGNFFTNKRMATYWIDDYIKTRNNISFAYYNDIKSIDTVYYAGLTYSPYMRVEKLDGTKFSVSVDGKRNAIKAFFEDAINEWKKNR